jgi:XTP/dITP diphosphohydrolase
MTSRISLLLATRNKHKILEIKDILGSEIEYVLIDDYLSIDIKEAGRTLTENSLAKARYAFEITGKPSLADDSGLFVTALNDAPGVFSSRYGKDDAERITRVLTELSGIQDRQAVFRAVFVYYTAPDSYHVFEGECRGEITREPRGTHGFGYDPIFQPRGHKHTFAELGQKTKNRISHRARALKKFRRFLDRP